MIKKVLAVILVLTVVVPLTVWGMSSAKASAEETNWDWDFNEKTHTLTITGTGDMTDYSVTRYTPWYDKRNQIISIVIEPGITSIGKCAFEGTTVKFVTFPNSLTKIGERAFYNCDNLFDVTMPDSITEIGIYSFYSCDSLETLILSNQLEQIPYCAFSHGIALKEITIPSSVKNVENYSFNDNNAILNLSEGLETIGDYAFSGIENDVLIIPDSVTKIGQHSFEYSSNLTKLVTGENLIEIGSSAFIYLEKLTTIDFSKSQNLSSIGGGAFKGASIKSVIIPDNVTNIESTAFGYCYNLTEVKLPKNLENIGSYAFAFAAIESIDIPENVLSIGASAFSSCANLKKIVIPHSVTTIDNSAFIGCKSLNAVDISGINLNLNRSPFSGLSDIITHVHIPAQLRPSYFAGKYGLPEDESCYFRIGADGVCSDPNCPFSEETGTTGDVNKDGKINNTDIILLGRAYMAGDGAKYLSVADMNNDGRITNADIILLGRLYMTGK